MIGRAVLLSAMILSAGLVSVRAGGEVPITRASLDTLPRAFDRWTRSIDLPLDPNTREVLGVDDYVNRTYLDAGSQPVSLYAGYYASQRQGDTIHSPQNCLPGAGWQPVEGGRTTLDAGGMPLPVNRYIIQKGLDRQVVLYWYHGRGRVVANEYANKFWLMVDAARLGRSDGALVRVVAPVTGGPRGTGESIAAADAAAAAFTRAIVPRLATVLP